MKNSITTALIALFAIVFFSTCKKEKPSCQDPSNPSCENYDPCYGKKTINTFFKVREGDNGFKPPGEWCQLIPCDTFNTSSVRFDAPDGNPANCTYEWQIGTEAEPRITNKGFEVDFSDYRQSNGYVDLWIPITLTIRTPLNACLTIPEDTLVTVKRELFFTNKQLTIFKPGDTLVKYKGFFMHKPNEEVILQHIRIQTGTFRNQNLPKDVVVGVPFTDTFFFPGICKFELCENYKHRKAYTFTTLNHCNEKYDYKVEFWERIFLEGTKKIKYIYVLDNLNGKKRYEFIGERIE